MEQSGLLFGYGDKLFFNQLVNRFFPVLNVDYNKLTPLISNIET